MVVIKGADITTDSAIKIAKQHGISEFLIGLTIVALGTSLPELASSLTAVSLGTPELAVSNILGSNIANIGLVLGIAAILFSKCIRCNVLKKDIYFLMFSVIATIVAFMDYMLTFTEGMLFIAIYLTYITWSIRSHKKTKKRKTEPAKVNDMILLIVGLSALTIGASYLISSGIGILTALGISKSAFGFIFIAVGTSLPELTASLMAMKKRHHSLAIGNIIGSNLFNTFVVFGAMAGMRAIPVVKTFYVTAMPILVILTLLLYMSIERKKLTRFDGMIFLLLYIVSIIRVF
ncbi:MAG: calcium/sodium antiporter [Nanohaloarchaea archaeon]|nr:calcium/sodium antiporter [Candidatus Nanohaloarchaea archaeon]